MSRDQQSGDIWSEMDANLQGRMRGYECGIDDGLKLGVITGAVGTVIALIAIRTVTELMFTETTDAE